MKQKLEVEGVLFDLVIGKQGAFSCIKSQRISLIMAVKEPGVQGSGRVQLVKRYFCYLKFKIST